MLKSVLGLAQISTDIHYHVLNKKQNKDLRRSFAKSFYDVTIRIQHEVFFVTKYRMQRNEYA